MKKLKIGALSSQVATMVALLSFLGLAAPAVRGATVNTFDSTTGFSGTQGANDWSYDDLYYTDSATSLNALSYNSFSNSWVDDSTTASSVAITSTGQNFDFNNGYDTVRTWTADQDYTSVDVAFSVVLPPDATASATNHTGYNGTIIVDYVNTANTVTQEYFAYGFGDVTGATYSNTFDLTDVAKGDSVEFILGTISPAGPDPSTNITFEDTLEATSVPEPSTWAMLAGGGALLLGVRFRRLLNS